MKDTNINVAAVEAINIAENLVKQNNLDEQVSKEMVTALNQTCFKYETGILQTQYRCFDELISIQHYN
jgi:hypothetical protein